MTLNQHPFDLFESTVQWVRERRHIVDSCDIGKHVMQHGAESLYLLGWKVTSKSTMTVHHKRMCFVTFSDKKGRFEVSLFPEVYEKYARELLRGFGPFLIKGHVELSFGVAEVVASNIKLLRCRGPQLCKA